MCVCVRYERPHLLVVVLQTRYSSVSLRTTNRLYVAQRLKMRSRFSHYMDRMFGADIKQVAFNRPTEAAELINSRVREDTNGTINTLIEPREWPVSGVAGGRSPCRQTYRSSTCWH